jgi:DNA-directed RNA polymerase subunit RPC12/RpoP
MKFKFLQAECEFDRDDAKVAVPLVLLGLGMAFTPIPKTWLLVAGGAYYLLLLFLLEPLKKRTEHLYKRRTSRCPYCKGSHTVLLGLSEYLGDAPYYWYRCNDCGEESVCVDGKLLKPEPGKKRKLTTG